MQAWVYPSEQQYYNAIKRKGYKASATDMPSTLAIHNAVNEKGWAMVKEWERERTAARTAGDHATIVEEEVADLRLLRFSGRPQDMSPKAWINTYLLGYRPPFDRLVSSKRAHAIFCHALIPTPDSWTEIRETDVSNDRR